MSDLHIHCPHFEICSGCSRNTHVDRLLILEEAARFFGAHAAPFFKLQAGQAVGWRCRAKLAVRGTAKQPLIGLFKEGSHEVVDIPFCRVHHPAINQAVEVVRQWMQAQALEPYAESQGGGLLRYVQVAVERSTGRVQLVLVLNCTQVDEKLRQQLAALRQAAPDLWHSLWLNLNTRRDNIIFSGEWIHIFGSFWLWEALNGQQVCFHPASFVQANLEMFERLIKRLAELLPPQADLLEFYAGVGAMGLALVEKCQRVQCVEINPLAEQCFMQTCRQLPAQLAARLTYMQGKSAAHVSLLNTLHTENGVVLVDPPRKGLEAVLLKAFCQPTSINKLIYVSCGWESFQRDCLQLLAAGWQIAHAEAFLFFPGSTHVEILAAFERQ